MSSLDLRNRYTYQDVMGIHNGDFVVNNQGQKIQITGIGYEVKRDSIVLVLTGTGPGAPTEHRVHINLSNIVLSDLQHKVDTQEKQMEMEFFEYPEHNFMGAESEPEVEEEKTKGEMIREVLKIINSALGDTEIKVFTIDVPDILKEKPKEKKPEPIDVGKGIEEILKDFGISMSGKASEGLRNTNNGLPTKDKPFDLDARLKKIQRESHKRSPEEYSRWSVKEGDLVATINPYHPAEDIEFHVVGEFRHDVKNYISGFVPFKSKIDGKIYPIWIPIKCFSNCSHMKPSARKNNLFTKPGESVLIGGRDVHTVAGFCEISGSLLVWPSGWNLERFIEHAPVNIYLQQVNSGYWEPFISSVN